ncbi:MAG: hypothetical protein IJ719_00450 [Clostridia bacterium]|nr:hypothetical protein [Clostridia bacterium]
MTGTWDGYRFSENELSALLVLTGRMPIGIDLSGASEEALEEGLRELQSKGFLFHAEKGNMLEHVLEFVISELNAAEQCLIYQESDERMACLYCCNVIWILLCKRRGVWQLLPIKKVDEAIKALRQYQNHEPEAGTLFVCDGQMKLIEPIQGSDILARCEIWANRKEA